MSYTAKDIRNVCLLGHSGTGKTSLVESMLYMTGSIDRLGKVTEGNTVCDSDPEEAKRQISISLAVAPVKFKGCKINVLDTPGYFDFSGEVMEGLRVADAGIIVGSAKGGLSVGTEKAWKYLQERNMPRAIYIAKTDEENGDFNGAWQTLREKFGRSVCPVMMPLWDEEKHIETLLDIVYRRAYQLEGKRRKEVPIPADKQDVVDELYDQLCESVAETSEEFMEKYFSGEPFTQEEVIQGLHNGVKDLTLCPVVCGSAFTGLGTLTLLDCIIKLFPNPVEIPNRKGTDMHGNKVEIDITEDGAPYAFVFKTTSDQYGRYSYIKVISGRLTPDMSVVNARTGNITKLGHLYTMCGKKATEVQEVCCGDIAAVSKLTDTRTNDSLCDPKHPVNLTAIPFPVANYTMAIAPKTKGQEDKVANGLVRLSEEDMTFHCVNNAETRQMVLTGTGDIQLSVLCAKLKDRFGVEVTLSPARVPYREKIRKKVKVEGKHKKQSGGHGQYGDVWIEFEPCDSEELVFAENVFGGSVPKNFFPAVEKGLRDSVQHGVLAGYPVVYLKATLVDGSYHPVDSSEMAFKTAASLAYKAGLAQANPVLLEPIGELHVIVPDSYTGDVMGDLNKRRGRVMGMNPVEAGEQEIVAEVPMGEMGTYAIDLRSMTQGRGMFTYAFLRYEDAPPAVQEKAIAEAKQMQGDEE
ncbi:elongation factor G [bacterium 210917-DFI.7.65]|nr:elongation factor G [Clostridiales bacterium]MCB6899465.1 elongation factor G [bacterium 210917-DFI.7.65]